VTLLSDAEESENCHVRTNWGGAGFGERASAGVSWGEGIRVGHVPSGSLSLSAVHQQSAIRLAVPTPGWDLGGDPVT